MGEKAEEKTEEKVEEKKKLSNKAGIILFSVVFLLILAFFYWFL